MPKHSKPPSYREVASKCYEICSKIYIARNISLSESEILNQLKEIDKLLREHNSNWMNDLGREYIKKAEKTLNQSGRAKDFIFYGPASSQYQERLLRFGEEFNAFGFELADTASVEKLIRASLIFDFCKERTIHHSNVWN